VGGQDQVRLEGHLALALGPVAHDDCLACRQEQDVPVQRTGCLRGRPDLAGGREEDPPGPFLHAQLAAGRVSRLQGPVGQGLDLSGQARGRVACHPRQHLAPGPPDRGEPGLDQEGFTVQDQAQAQGVIVEGRALELGGG